MRTLEDIMALENEDALEMLGDVLEPVVKILGDTKIQDMASKGNKLRLAQYVLKEHKAELVELLATIKGIPVSEYHATIGSMLKDLLRILNNEELMSFFG